jgi:hypothetical protein
MKKRKERMGKIELERRKRRKDHKRKRNEFQWFVADEVSVNAVRPQQQQQ